MDQWSERTKRTGKLPEHRWNLAHDRPEAMAFGVEFRIEGSSSASSDARNVA